VYGKKNQHSLQKHNKYLNESVRQLNASFDVKYGGTLVSQKVGGHHSFVSDAEDSLHRAIGSLPHLGNNLLVLGRPKTNI
jgi:hypothetical protein